LKIIIIKIVMGNKTKIFLIVCIAVYFLSMLGLQLALGSLAIIFEKKNSEGSGLSSALLNEVAD
jgi:hypothetical protein